MKTLLFVSLIISIPALAEFEKHEPARINFNQMIEANNQESQKIQNELGENGFGQRPEGFKKSKQKRVTDFLDAEMGWGEAPKVVDRRFNSVKEPIVVRLIPKS